MSDAIRAVEIEGTLKRLRTMADGSVDLTINLPEYCRAQAGQMLGWVNSLVVGVLEVRQTENQDVATIGRSSAKRRKQPGDPGV